MIPKMMKAVVLAEPVRAEDVRLTEVPVPESRPGWVLIRVKAFGMNHSEQILRNGEIRADYIRKPVVPGIECVGEVADPSDSRFQKGQRVMAFMGGMGRSFDGSYAQYVLAPSHHVFAAESGLSWTELAAVLDTGSLKDSEEFLKTVKTVGTVTKALELVGPKTLSDTLRCVKKGGVVCNTGILGGMYTLNDFDPIKGIPNGVYLTGFYSNGPTQEIMDEIFTFLTAYHQQPCVGKCFDFSEIREACLAQESGIVNGKIVVKVSG